MSVDALASIVIVGLNGALQKRFVLKEGVSLVPGNVHRAQVIQTGVGGKGQDVAVSLSCLKYPFKLAQFMGNGLEGDLVMAMLKQDDSTTTVRTKSPLRTCTTIVGPNGEATELVEPSGIIHQDEIQQLLSKLEKVQSLAVCFMGSMPPGCPTTTYANIYQTLQAPSLCLIDSVAGLEPLLETIANAKNQESSSQGQKRTILKVNESELARLAGHIKKEETSGSSREFLETVVKAFLEKYPNARQALSGLALTNGRHPAHFAVLTNNKKNKDDSFLTMIRLPIPQLSSNAVLYPIGAGDAVAAGTLASWNVLVEYHDDDGGGDDATGLRESLRSKRKKFLDMMQGNEDAANMVVAFGFGLACGSASCLCEENSVFRLEDVIRIHNEEISFEQQ